MINVEAMARGTPVVSFGVGGVRIPSNKDMQQANNDNDNNDHDNNARAWSQVPSMDQLLLPSVFVDGSFGGA